MSFTLTPSAEKFIRRMLRFSGGAGGFRLSVSAGGCSGLAAEFDVEPAPRPGDAVVAFGDVNLYVPAESHLLLDGVTVDFVETRVQSGFIFHDPKPGSCACSSTDTAAKPSNGLHQLREL
jgi:iron-sulfur cluster assembly accessory protein